MQTGQAFFSSELERLIKLEIDHLKDNLVTGSASIDYAGYKHQVGKIQGLQEALELIEEAWSIVNGGEQRGN